jgi:hypothetical protein
LAGLLWSSFNSSVAFFATSFITCAVIVFFLLAFKKQAEPI